MDREQIVEALTALAGELDRRGVSAEMYVVGGPAIALMPSRGFWSEPMLPPPTSSTCRGSVSSRPRRGVEELFDAA